MSKTGKYWLFAFFYAMLFLAVYGYQFNSSDQEEHLPQVYKILNPALYPNDYVVNSLLEHFSIRFFYVRVVYALSLLMPVAAACFLLMVTLLTVFGFYVIKLTDLFFKNDSVTLAAPMFCLIALNKFTVGGNALGDNMLTCTTFANVFCVAAFYCFFAGRKILPFVLAGAATLFQLLMGLHVFLLMAIITLVTNPDKRGIVDSLKGLGVYLLCSSPMLLPVFYRQFVMPQHNRELYYYAMYVFRNPHHYLPSFFPVMDYAKSLLLLLLAGVSILAMNPRFRKKLTLLLGFIVLGMLVYYWLLEVCGWQAVGKLQWFKTSMWLTLFCGIAISGWLLRFKKSLDFLNKKYAPWVAGCCGVLLLACMMNADKIKVNGIDTKYQVWHYKKSDLMLMHEWIRKNTAVDALMISFPTDESFLCEAQRPMPIGWKAIIHEPWFMNQWYVDFKGYYHLADDFKWEQKNAKSKAEESYYTFNNNTYFKKRGVRYRLDDTSVCKLNDLGKVVHVQGRYLLTEVN